MENNLKLELLKLRKITIKGYELNLATVSNIEIFESLTRPGITGLIDIKDYQALQELGNVFADDIISITFSVDNDENNELVLNFKIYTNEGSRQLALNTYDVLRLGFCSPWLVDGLCRNLSKAYSNKKISYIFEDLLKECGADIGYIEPTKQELESFVTPYWTAYHSIKYLTHFALNENDLGGYICWTDLRSGKVNVTTLDYLLSGKLGKYKEGFTVYPANYRFSGRVKNILIESSYDTIRMVNNGMPETRYYAFNYDTKQIVNTTDNIASFKSTRLSKKFPLSINYNTDRYVSHKYSPLFPQTANSIASDENKIMDLLNGYSKTNYAYMSSDVFKINIESLGEINRRVGWLTELDYPSVAANSNQNNDPVGNKQLKGMYLIREIKHQFSLLQDYTQYITLVNDGYFENNNDLITWSK